MKRPDLEAAAELAKYGASPPEMGRTISDLLAYVRHLEDLLFRASEIEHLRKQLEENWAKMGELKVYGDLPPWLKPKEK